MQPDDLIVLQEDTRVILEESDSILQNWYALHPSKRMYILRCILMASFCSALLGYDVGVFSGAVLFIEKYFNLTTFQKEMLVGSTHIIATVGALLAGKATDQFGRRKTIMLSSVIFIVGSIMTSLTSFWVLFLGRFVVGIGIGFGLVVSPLYVAEMSPAKLRGAMVTLCEICINLGILIGYAVSFGLASVLDESVSWRWMLGIGAIPPFLTLIFSFAIPESPRWLMSKGHKEEAELILSKILPAEGDVSKGIKEIEELLAIQKTSGWSDIFSPTPAVKRILLAGVGVAFYQQASGIEAAVYYTPTTFKNAGITDTSDLLAATVGVGLIKVLFIFVALFLMDRVGRKQLLMVGSAGLVISLTFLGFSFSLESPKVTVTAQCMFMAFFSLGFGPVTWVLSSEIYPLRMRGRAHSIGTATNRFMSGIIAMTYLSFSEAITTAGAFYFYGFVAFTGLIYVYYLVPETKGKTLEEIEKFFYDTYETRTTTRKGT